MKPGKETDAGKTPNDAGAGRSVLVIPNDEFFAQVCESLSEGRKVSFVVKGHSMYPFMRNEKDRVCLERYDGKNLDAGDVILFKYHGRHILHRVYDIARTPEGTPVYRTRGDGNVRGNEYAVPSAIFGVMSGRISPSGREWNCASLSWRLYSKVWMRLFPVRRWCLAVLRRIYR